VQTTKSLKLKSLNLQAASLRNLSNVISSISIVISAIAIAFSTVVVARGDVADTWLTVSFLPLFAVVYSVLGKKIHEKHSEHMVGWLFVFLGLNAAFSALLNSYVRFNPSFFAGYPTLLHYSKAFGGMIWVPLLIIPVTLVILYFPNGSLISPKWRIVVWASLLGIIFGMLTAFHSEPALIWEGSESLAADAKDRFLEGLMIVSPVLILSGFLGGLASIIIKFRRSKGAERRQIKWLVYGGLVTLMSWGIQSTIGPLLLEYSNFKFASDLMSQLTAFIIPVACGIAIVRYQLWDIDIIINRSLVYGGLTIFVVTGYILVVAVITALLPITDNRFLSLIAAGSIAVLFHPLRQRLQRVVNQKMFGLRNDPYTALSQLSRQLAAAPSPELTLQQVVETIAATLKLPYVAIQLYRNGQFQTKAAYGKPALETSSFPLVHQNQVIGQLVVAAQIGGEYIRESDQKLLEDISNQVSVAALTVRLNEDLRRSRQSLVTTREEERRHLRRNLHDNLGPTLASHTLKLDTAIDLIGSNPEVAIEHLESLKQQSKDLVADIRSLVYELRPPALDNLGLVGAVQSHIQHLPLNSQGLLVSLEVPSEGLKELSAAVESAAYYLILEALTNVVRHSQAQNCRVVLTQQNGNQPRLEIKIIDDGVGLPPIIQRGVGLSSMQERAEELEGHTYFQTGHNGGAEIYCQLPLYN
jgi:two-component system NarL family sensor kinase